MSTLNKQLQDLIERYARGGEKLALAIRGLTRDDLLQVPAADHPELGRWSIQHVVIHLADSELVVADRIKRVIAEDKPTLLAYDENKWAANLRYDEQSVDDALRTVELTRRQLGRVLMSLSPDTFEKSGTHTERGRVTLIGLIEGEDRHLEHHLSFINAKLAAMGKGMW